MKYFIFSFKEKYIIFVLLTIIIAIVPLIYLPYHDDFILMQTGYNEYTLSNPDNIYKPKFNVLIITALILLIVLLKKYRNNLKNQLNEKEYKYLFLFLSLLLLSTINSEYKWLAIYGRPYRWEGLLAYLAYIISFLSFSLLIKSFQDISRYIKVLFTSATLIAIYGMLQLFSYDFIPRDPVRLNWKRVFATLGNPNFAGSYIIMLLLMALLMYLHAKSKKNNVLFASLSSLFYSLMIATGTRGVWLAFMITMSFVFLLLRDKIFINYKKVLVLLFIFLIITISIDFYQGGYISNRFNSIITDMERLSSRDEDFDRIGAKRMFIYRNSIPLLLENPLLGSGLDTFAEIFPQELSNSRQVTDKAHSEYLQLGVTVGIPALIVYLIFLLILLKRGYKNLARENKYQQGLYFAFFAYIVQASFNISVIPVAPVFWAIAGMNLAINRILENGGTQ
ncbi:MAG: O-antigen ligase family protein [bacterium]